MDILFFSAQVHYHAFGFGSQKLDRYSLGVGEEGHVVGEVSSEKFLLGSCFGDGSVGRGKFPLGTTSTNKLILIETEFQQAAKLEFSN